MGLFYYLFAVLCVALESAGPFRRIGLCARLLDPRKMWAVTCSSLQLGGPPLLETEAVCPLVTQELEGLWDSDLSPLWKALGFPGPAGHTSPPDCLHSH